MARPPDKVNRNTGAKGKSKEQPRNADTGRFVTEDYAKKNPRKVEWVKHKK